ncbi:MAG: GAF domain-containing protein [Oscillospiraceae bacterium]|nr:GAF domain-containing protein [Oscillospiraceae bacterium]
MVDYKVLNEQLHALVEGIPHPIANLANASALLWQSLPELNWAGFYLRKGNKLVLGPFQGKTACIEIPLGRGVCGTAAAEDRSLLVEDVHCFCGHIACDSASQSEIVIPLHQNGEVVAVLDLDSPGKKRFSDDDRAGLEAFAAVLEQACFLPCLD